jgi:Transposase DDE domain/Transposase domain (DUF772)
MQSTPRERLLHYGDLLQGTLFAMLEAGTGPLSAKARLLVAVLEMLALSRQLPCARGWLGRPAKDRQALASAFLAKSVYGLETTRQLLERLRADHQLRCLCGWSSARQIPHESTFSRAFQEFAETELPQRLHEALILHTQQDRLIGHIARDATAIEARETFPESKPKHQKRKYPRRPKRAKACERGTRLERQRKQTLAQQLATLSQPCSIGTKKSSKGHQQYGRGYKLHLDVADGQIPISALLTGASVHDSQVAIPLMTMSSQRVTYLYDLMDSAYDARAIREHSLQLGHRPITDHPKRRRKVGERKVRLRKNSRSWKRVIDTEMRAAELTWAEQDRFAERTMVERVFSRLKDEFGARIIRVRGARKVMAHLLFGVLALTVDQLLKLAS